MEDTNIHLQWKKQCIDYDGSMLDLSPIDKAQDDIARIRKSWYRRNKMAAIGLLCNISLSIEFYYRCSTGEFTYPNLFRGSFFLFLAMLMLYRWLRAYRWQQAEIFMDTRAYLDLSARTIREYMSEQKRMYYTFFVFIALANVIFLFGGSSTVDLRIFQIVSVTSVIVLGLKTPSFIKKTQEDFGAVAQKIEVVLNNLNNENQTG